MHLCMDMDMDVVCMLVCVFRHMSFCFCMRMRVYVYMLVHKFVLYMSLFVHVCGCMQMYEPLMVIPGHTKSLSLNGRS